MKTITYIVLEEGDSEPIGIAFVKDTQGDEWLRTDNGWVLRSTSMPAGKWEDLVRVYGPMRIDREQIDSARETLEKEAKLAAGKLSDFNAYFGPSVTTTVRVFEEFSPEPRIDGIVLRDRQGDYWRYSADRNGWQLSEHTPDNFVGNYSKWSTVQEYAPLTVVPSP